MSGIRKLGVMRTINDVAIALDDGQRFKRLGKLGQVWQGAVHCENFAPKKGVRSMYFKILSFI
jgi:hypothetical protein